MKLTKTAAIALAATTIAGMAGIAATGTARAATPSCGHLCIDVFSHDFGTFGQPDFVLDVYKQGQAVGQPIILFRSSNVDPAEDFVASEQGTVNDFYLAGLVSAAVELHYGCVPSATVQCTQPGGVKFPNDEAYELEYAPYGAESGLCAGVGATAVTGTKISLQPCGASSKTVWIVDSLDSPATISVPLINGSDTNFSHPFVATYPASSYPTDNPRPQLYTAQLTGEASGSGPVNGTVDDNQLWAFEIGVLH